jgi:hypothetical protein
MKPVGLARCGPRHAEPPHRPLPTPALGAHRAHDDGGVRTQSDLHGATDGERLRHEPWQDLHREHPRHMVNSPDMARRTNS